MSQDPNQPFRNDGSNFTKTYHNDTYPFISHTKSNLSGKHILITGASRGVGKQTAIHYAKAGASKIAITGRSDLSSIVDAIKQGAQEAGKSEPEVLALNFDITDASAVEGAAKRVSDAFDGRLDVLIANAGYLSTLHPLPDTDPDEWWRDWEVNIKGVYLTIKYFFPLLLRSSLKVLIIISSVTAHSYGIPHASYAASKLAVLRIGEFVHEQHGPGTGKDGVVVIGAHPGGIKTELSMNTPEELHRHFRDEVELPADTLVWLGGERREWLGGRYVSANMDMEELEGRKEEIVRGDLLKVRLAVNSFPGQ